MQRPDIRERILSIVLQLLADYGVDDVHLIAALALHRRMTEAQLRHAVGDRVYDAFAPHGLLYNHDAEDPEGMAFLGATEQGEEVEINRRAAESDLLVYVNINLVAMDGGWKSTATGLASYRSLRHHHNVRTMLESRSFMDRHRSELHSSNWRMGKVLRDAGVTIFQIETTLNNDTFPEPFGFMNKREWEWSVKEQATYLAAKNLNDLGPSQARHQVWMRIRSPHGVTGVNAGATDPVHERTLARLHEQQLVEVDGQSDVMVIGIPYLGPYNVNSIMNPILAVCMSHESCLNMYRGRPLVRHGGVMIISHPLEKAFHKVHHPSYSDFYEQVLADTTDPRLVEEKYEQLYATDPWYTHRYRSSYANHGVHPFYMWYWGAHGMDHCGDVIWVGADRQAAHRMGFRAASSLGDALEMASDTVGRSPSMTYLHAPPLTLAEVR